MGELRRDPDKARAWRQRGRKSSQAWADRTRSRLAQQSERRKEQAKARKAVVAEVLRRAGARNPGDLSACQYRAIVPEVECGWLPDRRRLEVDELRGGAHRSIEWLNPDACRAPCPRHHEWKTENKRELLRRLAVYEGRTP